MIFKVLLLTVAAVAAVPLGAEQKWNEFKLTHNKIYDNHDEESYRFRVFSDFLQKMEEHNAKYKAGLVSWYMAVNQFSDMTTEEFLKFTECRDLPENLEGIGEIVNVSQPLADGIDYRSSFNLPRSQGHFGTCYAFSTTSAVEAYRNRAGYSKQILSPQDIIDCTFNVPPYNNHGAHGGFRPRTLQYMADKGITLEKDYPYVGNPGPCQHDRHPLAFKINGYKSIQNTEQNLKNALSTYGPLTIGVASKEWHGYGGGILHPINSFTGTNHVVVLVGYGTSNGEDYWIVRNSWGPTWGESGYIRVTARIVGNVHIGIAGPGSKPAQAVQL